MTIEVKIQSKTPCACPLEPFTLQDDHANLLPQVGDEITNGQTALEVKSRCFDYRADVVFVTLFCDY
jgi:hypothetical protein